MALWQEVARYIGTERSSRLLVPERERRGEGRNFHYPKTSSVSSSGFQWQLAKVAWWSWKGNGPVSAWSKIVVVASSVGQGKRRWERKSCVSLSLSLSLDFVCYLLTPLEPFLTACLSSKESEFILVLPFLFSFLQPRFLSSLFRLTFFSFLRWNLDMRLLWNLERWKRFDSGGILVFRKVFIFLWKFIELMYFFISKEICLKKLLFDFLFDEDLSVTR